MVELADVSQAMALKSELQSISVALDNFDKGGRIVAMSIAPPLPQPAEPPEGAPPVPPPPALLPPVGVTVSTVDIDYPPQMVASIKQALTQRRDAIAKQLAGMGVTGVQ